MTQKRAVFFLSICLAIFLFATRCTNNNDNKGDVSSNGDTSTITPVNLPMLTAGFHSASPPLIWRFDLERNHSFTLSLQGEEGEWELGVTGPKGDFYPVGHFVSRDDAEEAFARVEKLLACRRAGWPSVVRALIGLVALIIAIFAGVALFVLYVHTPHSAALSTPLGAASPAVMPAGVPVSKDTVI